MDPIPTLRWDTDRLVLLDQRKLPLTEEYLECTDVETLAEAIRELAVRGAPAIGLAAAYGAVLAAITTPDEGRFFEEIERKLGLIESTRPTAVNLFHCLSEQRQVLESTQVKAQAVDALLQNADRMYGEDLEASRSMGRFGADLLEPGVSLLTHCNAGGLATAGLGTALAVVYEAAERGWVDRVYADETRPLLQGSRLTAWELSRAGIPVTVLPDSAAASLLRSGAVDAVFVGSDRVAVNGDIANKIGTYPLALAAREHGVPFYVVAPLTTFDPEAQSGAAIEIEEREQAEIELLAGARVVPRGVLVYNPAFDITPSSLITAIITEKGVIK